MEIIIFNFFPDDSCYFGAITVGNKCCSTGNKCGIGGGDCDADNECETGLICGHNNCREFNRKAGLGADCCTKRCKWYFQIFGNND